MLRLLLLVILATYLLICVVLTTTITAEAMIYFLIGVFVLKNLVAAAIPFDCGAAQIIMRCRGCCRHTCNHLL